MRQEEVEGWGVRLEEGWELDELPDVGEDLGGPGGDEAPVGAALLHLQAGDAVHQHALHPPTPAQEYQYVLLCTSGLYNALNRFMRIF